MEKDVALLRYLSDNDRYADLLNGFICDGKQMIHAEDLMERDVQTGIWSYSEKQRRGWKKSQKKYRDLIRRVAFGVNFAVVGVENQSEVDNLMALRTMHYDVGEYEQQAAVIRKQIRKRKNLTGRELLSGFADDCRLHPCITLVLFYGDEWDGSRDLYDILDFTDIPNELRVMVNNYKIHLLEVRSLKDTDVYKTDLKQVFDFIRYSKDKEKLRELVQNDAAYAEMEEDAYDVAVTFTKAEKLIPMKEVCEKEGKVNMCQALNELLQDSKEEGKIEGKIEGETEGRETERKRFLTLLERMVLQGEAERIADLSGNEKLLEEMYQKYHL